MHVVRGTVSAFPLSLGPVAGVAGVGTHTFSSGGGQRGELPNLGVQQIEQRIRRRFDTLLIDCEGCIGSILGNHSTGVSMLHQLSLILIEQDGFPERGYEEYWWPRLQMFGFVRVWRSHAWYSAPRPSDGHTLEGRSESRQADAYLRSGSILEACALPATS